MTKLQILLACFLIFIGIQLVLPLRINLPRNNYVVCSGINFDDGCETPIDRRHVRTLTQLLNSDVSYDTDTAKDFFRNTAVALVISGAVYYVLSRKMLHRK